MKKIIVSMLLLLPLGLVAQEIKIATVDQSEIYNLMPELSAMENDIATMSKQYDDMLKSMHDEYTRKFSDLTAQGDTLTENIRIIRVQEIEDLRARIENLATSAQEEVKKKQESLFIPIQDKLIKAINSVGEENGYTYILDPRVLLFKGSSAIDATDKVKAKMGLK